MVRNFLHAFSLSLIFCVTASGQFVSRYERPISTPIFFISQAETQFSDQPDTLSKLHLNEDSLIAAQIGVVDTTVLPPKSTTIAMLSTMILPGAGQIYNESYWKAPVVWGLGYYFYSVYKNQNKLYREVRTKYETALIAHDTTTNAIAKEDLSKQISYYLDTRKFHERQRNEFGWYLAITYVMTILDAYVDAALYNFEVSPNLQGTNDWRMQARIPIR
ncbi:MAG: DUF5683 domain-containing protein [Bacteroidota bacterium]|nr:DUF5683 domain-containing protein [Bacteroidota bacterium]